MWRVHVTEALIGRRSADISGCWLRSRATALLDAIADTRWCPGPVNSTSGKWLKANTFIKLLLEHAYPVRFNQF